MLSKAFPAQRTSLFFPAFVKSDKIVFLNGSIEHFRTMNPEPAHFVLAQSSSINRPIFCRMEDHLYKRFNVWIVLRAGSDDDYRRLAFPGGVR